MANWVAQYDAVGNIVDYKWDTSVDVGYAWDPSKTDDPTGALGPMTPKPYIGAQGFDPNADPRGYITAMYGYDPVDPYGLKAQADVVAASAAAKAKEDEAAQKKKDDEAKAKLPPTAINTFNAKGSFNGWAMDRKNKRQKI